MLNLKYYFTAKPNGQLLHLIPTSSFRKMSAARKSVCMWARGCTLTINNYFIWSNFRFATPFFSIPNFHVQNGSSNLLYWYSRRDYLSL